MISNKEILARMLFKLVNASCFKKGHMLEERILSVVAKSDRGLAKTVFKRALKEGFIVPYGKTNYGEAYQLDVSRISEIFEIVKKYHKNPDSMKL